jgi:NAD(P)-dependent dehydrogenase (short-subunit alcohol dehydrogenase family)
MTLRIDLEGQTALVTGASRGLGQAMARALASAGAHVVALGRSPAGLETTVKAIHAAGGSAEADVFDLTDLAALPGHIADLAKRCGALDILINNAGVEEVTPSLDVTEAIWDRIVDTNLKAAFFTAQAVARTMAERQRPGAIVNIASLTSFVGIPTAAPYGASKTGLLGLTRALSTEWAPLGIRVNAIAPGYFRTDMTEVFYRDADWQAAMLAKIPQGRFGRPDDIAGAVVFLSSPAAAYITGQCLGIDGGYLASI